MEDFVDFDYDHYEKSWESLPLAAGLGAGFMFLKYDLVSKALLISAFGPVVPWLLVPVLFATLFLQLLIGLKLFWNKYPCEMKWEEKFLILTLPFSACVLSLLLTVAAFNTITVGWLVGAVLIATTMGTLMSAYLYCKMNGIDIFPAACKTKKLSISLEQNHEDFALPKSPSDSQPYQRVDSKERTPPQERRRCYFLHN